MKQNTAFFCKLTGRTGLSVLGGLFAVLVSSSGAAIGADIFQEKSTGYGMYASIWGQNENDAYCGTKFVWASVGEKSVRGDSGGVSDIPQLFVNIYTNNWCTGRSKYTYGTIPAVVAEVRGKLNTAHFTGSGDFTVHDDITGSETIEKVSVNLIFTGVGDLDQRTDTHTYASSEYRFRARMTGVRRWAELDGSYVTLGDETISLVPNGTTSIADAAMSEGSNMSMVITK